MTPLLFSALLSLPLSADPPKTPPAREVFLGALRIGGEGPVFAVMSSTESLLDGKPIRYNDIPDEGTELVEITIDMKRRVVLKVCYVRLKEI